jgi:hypothetical protein
MPRRRTQIAYVGALVVLVLVLSFADRVVLVFPPSVIERYLARATPLGTDESDVMSWLRKQGLSPNLARVHVPPSPPSDYPLTRVGGEAFIHESIGHYRLIFRTDVEVFYVFDATGKLADLRVRKSVDSI